MSIQDEFPPVGEKDIGESQKFVIELLGVVLFSTLVWAFFRFITQDIVGDVESISFNIYYMIFAPVIFLGPMMLYWVKHRGEEGLPVRLFAYNSPQATFTKRMVTCVLVIGFSLTIVNFLLELILDYMVLNSGMYGEIEFNFLWMEGVDSIFAYFILIVTHLAVVATVEEFFFRGFVQDQLSRVVKFWQSILISATIFAMTHIPIAIFIYEIEGLWLTTSLINWFGFGLAAGYLYHITRNIWAVVVWHGIWNVTVSTITWSVYVYEIPSPGLEKFVWISQTILINALLLTCIYFARNYLAEFGRFEKFPTAPKSIEVKL
jgi:membrane protease YdiL (CAAX protease family)